MLTTQQNTDRRGNKQLLAINVMNIFIYIGTKVYYKWRNSQREKKWNALSKEVGFAFCFFWRPNDKADMRLQEQLAYLDSTEDSGSKRLDFRFSH